MIIYQSVLEVNHSIVLSTQLVLKDHEMRSTSSPDNQITLLLVKGKPIERHGACYGRLDCTPEIHPDLSISDDKIDHVIYQGWPMLTTGQFLMRD